MNRKVLLSYVFRFLPGALGMKYKRRYYRRLVNQAQNEFNSVVGNLTKDSTVIDLGANRGKYTRVLAENAGRVIAFEPDPVAFSILQREVQNYGNVELINAAISNKDGEALMFRREGFNDNPESYTEGTTLFSEKDNINAGNSISVNVVNIVDYIDSLDSNIALIKMDIEGAEVDVLEGLLDSDLISRIEYIFVETHEFKIASLYDRTMALRKRVKNLDCPVINLNWG